jgi:hypothetical protein
VPASLVENPNWEKVLQTCQYCYINLHSKTHPGTTGSDSIFTNTFLFDSLYDTNVEIPPFSHSFHTPIGYINPSNPQTSTDQRKEAAAFPWKPDSIIRHELVCRENARKHAYLCRVRQQLSERKPQIELEVLKWTSVAAKEPCKNHE